MAEETQPTQTSEPQPQQPTGTSMLEEAKAVSAEIKNSITEFKELVAKNQEAATRIALGGEAPAGQSIDKPKEKTPEEYAKAVMAGEYNEKRVQGSESKDWL